MFKHVVYRVERFITKAPSEYKLAGLYVMDAMIRSSQRHTKEKDVYAPRFAKNLSSVFSQAYTACPEKDKVRYDFDILDPCDYVVCVSFRFCE